MDTSIGKGEKSALAMDSHLSTPTHQYTSIPALSIVKKIPALNEVKLVMKRCTKMCITLENFAKWCGSTSLCI